MNGKQLRIEKDDSRLPRFDSIVMSGAWSKEIILLAHVFYLSYKSNTTKTTK